MGLLIYYCILYINRFYSMDLFILYRRFHACSCLESDKNYDVMLFLSALKETRCEISAHRKKPML